MKANRAFKFCQLRYSWSRSELVHFATIVTALCYTCFLTFNFGLSVTPLFIVLIMVVYVPFKQAPDNHFNQEIKTQVENSIKNFSSVSNNNELKSTLNRIFQAIELSYILIPGATKRGVNKNESVQKVIEAIQKSFSPKAIRITLFDSTSSLSARRYLVGYPNILNTDEDAPIDKLHIRSAKLCFGGRVFGNLDLEFLDASKHTEDFMLQFELVASYCSILLMNDEFNEELLRLRTLSEETLRTKTGFLATLSHEIRGPLGVILNSVELITDGLCGEVTPMQVDTLKMVKKSSTHLLDLVNDVLDYARIESGVVEAKTISISLQDILSDMGTIVRSQAIKKHQKLIIERGPDRQGILCDKRHIRQILINLLTNAIKYTPEGGKIILSGEEVEPGIVRISVSDTGVGIPPEQCSRVFAPFERIDDEYSNTQVGTGLGMALTKKLVEGNRGIIDFDSVVGVGSNFWIELPGVQLEKVSTETVDGLEIKVGKGEELIILEPDAEQRLMFSKSLEQRGFNVTSASSASEAISACRTKVFSAMVIETDLPDFNAAELIQNIRAVPSGTKLPIVVMSGKAFTFDVEHFLKLGVDRCLAKPFTLAELAATMRRLLDEVTTIEESSTTLPQVH